MKNIIKLILTLIAIGVIIMGALSLPGFLKETLTGEKTKVTEPVKNIVEKKPSSSKVNRYSISTSTKEASKIGAEVLESGGNAVDAAIAISYALGVSEPYASGIGGGGGMLIYDPKSGYQAIDYRDRAPLSQNSMDPTMMGVPGFVAGMDYLANEYGTKSISELIEPSIKLASEGFEVSDIYARFIDKYSSILADNSDYQKKDSTFYSEGDIIKLPKLAETMRLISEKGPDGFYKGKVANDIEEKTWLKKSDLSSVKVDIREPVISTFEGNEIASMPAPFAGVTLIQMLKMAEKIGLPNPQTDPESYMTKYYKIKNASYDDRKRKIADPAFTPSDGNLLVSDSHIDELISREEYSDEEEENDSTNTTHFTVIDNDGMVVSTTNTLGYFYGSGVEVDGVYFNSAMRSFSPSGTGINRYEPGKKTRNFTAPTIIREKKGDILAIGTPGGNMIPEFIFQVLVDHYLLGTELDTATQKNRINLLDNQSLIIESNPKRQDLINQSSLISRDYIKKNSDDYFGSIQISKMSSDSEMSGAADTRRRGQVIISN